MESGCHDIESKRRVSFIDIAKGIGICFVVVEHHKYISVTHPNLQKIILSFHMPLFYFLSGYFFNKNCELKAHFAKRYHSLIKPYLCLSITFLVLFFLKNQDISYSADGIYGIFYGSSRTLRWPYGTYWFFTSLFVTSIAYYVLYHRLLSKIKIATYRLSLLAFIITCAYAINLFLKKNASLQDMPWNFDLVLFTLFFYSMGFEYRMSKYSGTVENKWLLFANFIILIVSYGYLYDKDGYVLNFFYRRYESLFFNTFEALMAIFVIVMASKQISRNTNLISKPLTYMGERSLTIFMFHSFVLSYVSKYMILIFHGQAAVEFILSVCITIIISLFLHELILKSHIISNLYLNIDSHQRSLQKSLVPKKVD